VERYEAFERLKNKFEVKNEDFKKQHFAIVRLQLI